MIIRLIAVYYLYIYCTVFPCCPQASRTDSQSWMTRAEQRFCIAASVWGEMTELSCDSSSAFPAFNMRDSFLNASTTAAVSLTAGITVPRQQIPRLTRIHDPHLLSQVLFRFQTPGGWTTNFLCSFVMEKNTQWSLPVPHVTCKIHHNNVVGGHIALSFLLSTSVLKY